MKKSIMKLLIYLLIGFLIIDLSCDCAVSKISSVRKIWPYRKLSIKSFLQYVKFTKVDCITSGMTCSKLKCNVKPISREKSFMNINCESLARPINNFKVTSYYNAIWKKKLNFSTVLRLFMENKFGRKFETDFQSERFTCMLNSRQHRFVPCFQRRCWLVEPHFSLMHPQVSLHGCTIRKVKLF